MASANALAPLRWKRAKIHRGSRRRRSLTPHKEAGYTSAVVTLGPKFAKPACNRAGSIYVQTCPLFAHCCRRRVGFEPPQSILGRHRVSDRMSGLEKARDLVEWALCCPTAFFDLNWPIAATGNHLASCRKRTARPPKLRAKSHLRVSAPSRAWYSYEALSKIAP
jgi:hypothetical protein